MLAIEVPSNVNTPNGLSHNAGIQDLDERGLVAQAKSGHQDAFGELYERHRLKTFRTTLRILRNQQDAEDAVQRAFQRALMNLQRFREDSTFSTWLTRIAINEALMLLRQRRVPDLPHGSTADAAPGDTGVEIVDGGPTPEEILCESERHAVLLQAIGRLRKKLKIVVLHRELGGLTSAQTASLLGLTVAAVKARAYHARRSLRKHLEPSFKRADASSKFQKRKA